MITSHFFYRRQNRLANDKKEWNKWIRFWELRRYRSEIIWWNHIWKLHLKFLMQPNRCNSADYSIQSCDWQWKRSIFSGYMQQKRRLYSNIFNQSIDRVLLLFHWGRHKPWRAWAWCIIDCAFICNYCSFSKLDMCPESEVYVVNRPLTCSRQCPPDRREQAIRLWYRTYSWSTTIAHTCWLLSAAPCCPTEGQFNYGSCSSAFGCIFYFRFCFHFYARRRELDHYYGDVSLYAAHVLHDCPADAGWIYA